MTISVQVKNVSKKFSLKRSQPRSWQEVLLNFFKKQAEEETDRGSFWVLKNISFEIPQGETVGLIGTNGVGKSTLLKLLANIIKPTHGTIRINGRTSSLLELGTGFHPELTGRENVYLNGAVMGLNRTQIRRKLDEIIAFAELEQFIDMPVKHYSSGMYVRLGFSVAVHTEPTILLVDEVLAVGDAAFQKKCIKQINQLQRDEVTILFVSHNAELVRQVCQRVIWLDNGKIAADGAADSVVTQYTWRSYNKSTTLTEGTEQRWGSGEARIEQVRLIDVNGQERYNFTTGEPLTVELHYRASHRVECPVFGLAIHRSDGTHITGPNTQATGYEIPWIEGEGVIRYSIPSLPLLQDTYFISVAIHNKEDTQIFDYHDRLYPFWVIQSEGERYGIISLNGGWSWNGHTNGESG